MANCLPVTRREVEGYRISVAIACSGYIGLNFLMFTFGTLSGCEVAMMKPQISLMALTDIAVFAESGCSRNIETRVGTYAVESYPRNHQVIER